MEDYARIITEELLRQKQEIKDLKSFFALQLKNYREEVTRLQYEIRNLILRLNVYSERMKKLQHKELKDQLNKFY